jgi:hypothetical protein
MDATHYTNPECELRGINHLALVCRDMQETVDFYTPAASSFWGHPATADYRCARRGFGRYCGACIPLQVPATAVISPWR